MQNQKARSAVVCFMLMLTALHAMAPAATVSWDGLGFNDLWSSTFNWDPNGSPAGCDVTIGDLASAMGDTTLIDATFAIDSLTVLNNASVVNSPDGGSTDFELQVNGLVEIDSGGSFLMFGGAADALDTEELLIRDGFVELDSTQPVGQARLEIESGAASALDIRANGTLQGNGRIDLEGSPAAPTRALRNSGTITAGYLGFNPIVVPATELELNATSANSLFDMDGTTEAGIVNVNRNATFDVNVDYNDDFDGELNLRGGSTFDTAHLLKTGAGAQINIETTDQFGSSTGAARFAGETVHLFNGTLTLAEANDKLIFDSYALMSSTATVENSGTIVFNNGALAFPDFQMNGPRASIEVGENSSVRISDSDFNLDGDGALTNVTTVEAGGRLEIELSDLTADDSYNGTINLHGGELDVVNNADNTWSIGSALGNGVLNAGAAATSTLLGDELTIFRDVNVLADSTLVVDTASVTMGELADINIETGATLNFNTDTNWVSDGTSVTGGGTLRPGPVTVGNATSGNDVTWDVANVDLDDGGLVVIADNSSLTVNADVIDTNDGKFSQDMVIGNQAQLELNLGGTTAEFGANSWVFVDGDLFGETTFFASSDDTPFLVGGRLTTNTGSASTARLVITSQNVEISSSAYLKLAGGNQSPGSTNELEGGIINGPGELRIANGKALRGFGRIDAPVNGNGNAQLIGVSGGQMNVNADIIQMGTIGTDGGNMNITVPWNTNVTNDVRLAGGLLLGATITNDGAAGINGWGTVTSEIINNTRVDAEDGNVLTIDNPANDWDGTTDTGALNAISGDLELIDDVGFAFGGFVRAAQGREVFANGFGLQFLPTSTIELEGGTYRTTENTDFLGTLDVSVAQSRLQSEGEFLFRNGAVATLDSNLLLANGSTVVESGVTFAGGASLLNPAGGDLRLLDGADFDVLLQNDGRLALGASPGQVTGLDYRQLSAGTLEIELEGIGITDFDRLTLNGLAELDGTLEVSLLSGFAPSLGDSFSILSAVGGVSGTFSTLDLPSLAAGLQWDIAYDPTLVNLMVIAMSGDPDFNMDGALDCADVDALVADIANGNNTPEFDLTGDGFVDTDDLEQWLADAGASNLVSGNPYLAGDANLDGIVDGLDFIEWNDNKFTNTPAWCSGDFNADGIVDGLDFIAWNDNKFTASDFVAVPEPTHIGLLILGTFLLPRRRHRS